LGYKPTEIIWGEFEGRIMPVKFIGKPSRWFVYDDNNELRFLSSKNSLHGILVPPNKFIVSRNKATYDNPYGRAVMSPCFWPVTFRRDVWKWWVILTEKFGIPFLSATAPAGAKEDKIEEMADMLADMVQDGVAVVPEEWKIEILETNVNNGKSESIHKTFMDSVNIEIAMAVLGTNLTTEVQGGSLAASKSHMEVRDDIIESDTIMIENSFNELIQINHSFNFSSEPPKFKLFSEEEIELNRAKRDLDIQKGNPSFKFTSKYYQERYNLNEDDFIIEDNIVEPVGD